MSSKFNKHFHKYLKLRLKKILLDYHRKIKKNRLNVIIHDIPQFHSNEHKSYEVLWAYSLEELEEQIYNVLCRVKFKEKLARELRLNKEDFQLRVVDNFIIFDGRPHVLK